EGVTRDGSDPRGRDSMLARNLQNPLDIVRGTRDHRSALCLAEEQRGRVDLTRSGLVQGDVHADVARNGRLGECDGKPTLGAVVRALRETRLRERYERALQGALALEIDTGCIAGHQAVNDLQVLAAAKLVRVLAQQHDRIAFVAERHADMLLDVLE